MPLDDADAKDAEDVLFFGLVCGLENELGYFSLRELEALCGPGGIPIERDLYWKPCTLAELQQAIAAKNYAQL